MNEALKAVHRQSSLKPSGVFEDIFRSVTAIFILAIPLTNFPWFPNQLRTIIAPALLYPLLLLLFLGLYLIGKTRSVRRVGVALIALVTIFCILSVAPLIFTTYEDVASLNVVIPRMFRSLLTVGIAGLTFLGALLCTSSLRGGANWTVSVVSVGLILMLTVAILAIGAMLGVPSLAEAYTFLRELFTTSGENVIGRYRRLALLAFEPSFAGMELTGWWLPFVLSAAIVLRRTWSWITAVLLIVLAGLTQSLTGLFGLAGLIAMLMFTPVISKKLAKVASRTLVFAISLIIVLSLIDSEKITSVSDRIEAQASLIMSGRFAREGPSDGSLAVRYGLAQTAFNVWARFPVLGAGTGLAGYWFQAEVPDWVYVNLRMDEYWSYVRNPDAGVFPSAKNLYLRILSENGLVGLFLFLALVFIMFLRTQRLYRQLSNCTASDVFTKERIILLASIFGTVAMMANYFSVDSYAIPFLWTWWGLSEGIGARARALLEDAE